ncbi:uncharacterized protein sb:cb1058 [Stegostoma tigrinum]|uniref:uncharacterized protein sb:cb1058 n=1 Tax=Stegostoma tigrinum TaxID=3053191 RepID=UPI00202B091E|nr:uncharacterized protein sb:cb1058 [Stegostoma tigrinum]
MKEQINSDCGAQGIETMAGPFYPEAPSFLDKSPGFYTRLGETEAEVEAAFGDEGLTSWKSDSPLCPESHADTRPQPRGRSKKAGGPRLEGDKCDASKGVLPAVTHRNEGMKRSSRNHRTSTNHTGVLSDDHQLLLKRRAKWRDNNPGTQRKNKVFRKYREDFDRAFRRGWEHFLANIYRLTR